MSSGFLRGAFAFALSVSLAGCSSIGTINGAQLDDQQTVTDRPLICGDYEWLCIGAGLAAFGGVVWALQENGNH
jgi:hypothetical protein